MIPGLEERIMGGSEEEVVFIADLVRTLTVYSPASYLTESQIKKGAASARADDTKSLKGAILDWITPRGQPLNPPCLVMSRLIGAFITSARELCYALPVWIGRTMSSFYVMFGVGLLLTFY